MTSVVASDALAHRRAEDRQTSGSLWDEAPFPSRLLKSEVRVRLHAHVLAEACRALADRARAMLELPVPVRALDSLSGPGEVRSLDALDPASGVAPAGEIPDKAGELDQCPAAEGGKVA